VDLSEKARVCRPTVLSSLAAPVVCILTSRYSHATILHLFQGLRIACSAIEPQDIAFAPGLARRLVTSPPHPHLRLFAPPLPLSLILILVPTDFSFLASPTSIMSFFKKKEKAKDKDDSKTDVKPLKTKKPKVHDIWEACEQGSLEGFEKIIKKKNGAAQLNQPNEEGRWPIHIAVGAGHVALAEALLANGAQCNMIESTEARWNVLHWAVASRSFEMMKLIVTQPGLKRMYSQQIIYSVF